jgi:peptidoglycan/LPS O-acetylase OafA/YrhL
MSGAGIDAATAKFHAGPLQIPSLDGLRAVAFLLVFVSHAGWQRSVPGGFGVTIFFFLSGYLITTLLRQELAHRGAISLRLFYARRLLRIWPPFYIVLAVVTIATLAGLLTMKLQSGALWALALHVTNYRTIFFGLDGAPPGTRVYWSLAVEEHFYLLFPLLFIGLNHLGWTRRTQAGVLWTICGLVLFWRAALVIGFQVGTDRTYMGTDTRFDSLLFGCALAVYGNPALDPTRFRPGTWRNVFLPAGLALLFLTFLVRGGVFRETARYTLQGVGLVPVFVAAIRYPAWGPFQFLNWAWIRWLGLLSYSLYLLHYSVLHGVQENLSLARLPSAMLALAISIGLAYTMYLLVERPAARLRKRLSRA